MPYIFTPPSADRPVGVDPLWSRFHFQVGQAVLKKDGFYTASEVVTDEDFAAADVAYLGGHIYLVSDAEAAALTAAGYGQFLVAPIVATGYGQGRFGAGTYGEGEETQGTSFGDGSYGTGIYGE